MLTSPVANVITMQTDKEMNDQSDLSDEMSMLFCVFIGYKDIEKYMLKKYKEFNHKPSHNNRIVEQKITRCVVIKEILLNFRITIIHK